MNQEMKEFQQMLDQKLCGYQESLRGGAKISLNEIIDELRSDVQRYIDEHPTDQ